MEGYSFQYLLGLAVTAAGGEELSPIAQLITHIVCFALVYWILSKYAFGPIMQVIDERRNRIESDLKQAEDLRLKAESDKAELEDRLRNIEDESRAKMQSMINEGKQAATLIQENARKESADMIQKAKENIQYETEKARETLRNEVVNLTIEATERLIKERLDDDKHRQLIGDFLDRVERN